MACPTEHILGLIKGRKIVVMWYFNVYSCLTVFWWDCVNVFPSYIYEGRQRKASVTKCYSEGECQGGREGRGGKCVYKAILEGRFVRNILSFYYLSV